MKQRHPSSNAKEKGLPSKKDKREQSGDGKMQSKGESRGGGDAGLGGGVRPGPERKKEWERLSLPRDLAQKFRQQSQTNGSLRQRGRGYRAKKGREGN